MNQTCIIFLDEETAGITKVALSYYIFKQKALFSTIQLFEIAHVILFIFSALLEPSCLYVLKVCALCVCLCRVVHSYTVG